MEMFEMANATELEAATDYGVYETKRYDVGDDLKITLPKEVDTESIQIRGLEAGDEATTGTYKVEGGTDADVTITFAEGDVTAGDMVRVSYMRKAATVQKMVVKTTSPTARGMAEIEYPVYSAGTDCTESAIKGILRLRIHRCRVTAMPGFDTSYKTAATNSVTFAAMDPKRADGAVYELTWEELANEE
jgi:hypothetical protein